MKTSRFLPALLCALLPALALADPTITAQPVATTITAGQGSTLSVVATTTGTGPLTYQWRKFGSPLAGANGSSLALSSTTLPDAGYYDVVVGDGLASVTSKSVRVDIAPAAANYGNVYRPRANAPRIEVISGNVTAIAVDPSDANKIYVAGEFTRINSTVRLNIARFLADGSFDSTWAPVSIIGGGLIRALLVEADGLIIAGDFSSVGGTPRGRLAKLSKTDGSLITSFTSGAGANGSIFSLASQVMADASVRFLAGGSFTTYNGTTVNRLIRLDATGSIDPSFIVSPTGTAGFGSDVRALVVDGSGDTATIYAGGLFTSHHGVTTNRNRLVRLTVNGAYDSTFNIGTGLNNSVFALALSGTGGAAKVYAGGQFTSVNDVTANRNRIARLDATGAYETSFAVGSGFGGDVNSLALDAAGNVYVGGGFTSFNGTTTNRNRLLRLTSAGAYDTTFNNNAGGANSTVNTLLLREDLTTPANSRLLFGGFFTTWNGNARDSFARVATDAAAALDTSPAATFRRPGIVYAIEPAPNGKWYIGGFFNFIDDQARNHFALLNADGALDSSFTLPGTGFNGSVSALAVQGDGRIVAAGNFTSYAGTSRGDILRLHPDATLDSSFNPGTGFNSNVNGVQLRPDGRIVAAGNFTSYNGTTRNRLARLLPDGALDTTFDPGAGFTQNFNAPAPLALQSDGKLLVGGTFTAYNGTTANGIVRVLDTGLIDTTYNSGGAGFASNTDVRQIATRLNDQLVVSGAFTTYNGTARSRIARIADTGALDTVFAPNTGANNSVTAFHVQPDDKTILAGFYTAVLGVTRPVFSRFTATGTLDSAFIVPTVINPHNGINVIRPDAAGNLLVAATRIDFAEFTGRGTLVVLEPAPVPAITAPPVAQTGTAGGSATFSVTATGENVQFQWLKNGVPLATGGNVTGATAASLQLSNLTLADVASYSVVVTNLYGTVTSAAVPLTGSAPLPTITTQPVAISGTVGGGTTLTITASPGSGGGTLAYQWRKFGVPLAGATTATLNLTNLGLEAAGYYDVVVSDNLTLRASAGAQVTVAAATLPVAPLRARPSFEPRVETNGQVYAFAPLADGRFYAGGSFTTIDGVPASSLARFNANGSHDTTWTAPVIAGTVTGLALQADGKLVIAGTFIYVGGRNTFRLARLNTDGSVDTTFAVGSGFSGGTVNAVAIQSDQKILVGGAFTGFDGRTAGRIIRLNSDGTPDSTFATGTGFDAAVSALALQSDGKVIVGGSFTTFGATAAGRIIRLNADGTRDATLVTGTGFDNNVTTLALYSDGRILVGGNFATYDGVSSRGLARLSAAGVRDSAIPVGTGLGTVAFSMAIQSDGKILLGGQFISYNGSTANRLLRIDGTTGAIDTSLSVPLASNGINNTVRAVALQAGSGRILVGGAFTVVGTDTRFGFARFNTDGTLDSVAPSIREPGQVWALAPVAGGKFIIGGFFSHLGGVATPGNLARLDASGALDTSFAIGAGANNVVAAITRQGDGKLLVGGSFTSFAGTNVNRLVRLAVDGALDMPFINSIGTGASGQINAIALAPDGRIAIGGTFATFNGATVNRVARLNSDGLLDSAFAAANGTGFSSTVSITSLAVQPDGRVVAGGSAGTLNGVPQAGTFNAAPFNGLVRLLAGGGADSSFAVGSGFALNTSQINGTLGIRSLVLQPDGRLLVGGVFTSYNGLAASCIARLETTGAFDHSFAIGSGFNTWVDELLLQPDGSVIAAGGFSSFNGQRRGGLARLTPSGVLDLRFGLPLPTGGFPIGVGAFAFAADGSVILSHFGRSDFIDRAGGALMLLEPTSSPTLLTLPFSGGVPAGSSYTLSASAAGTPPLSYVWKRNNVALVESVTGTTGIATDTLRFANVQSGDSGVYTLTVTDGLGASVTTPPVTLSVLGAPPVLGNISGPFGAVSQAGTATYLTVPYSGTTPSAVTWTKDGAPVSGGFYNAGQLYLPLVPARTTDAGAYQVTVTNALGTATSLPTRHWVSAESGWTPHNPRPSPQGLQSVYVANNQFFASGVRGARFSSADGITWNPLPSLSQNNVFGYLEGNGRKLLIGSLGFVASTTDGDTWKTGTLPTLQPVQGLAYGANLFVVSTTHSGSPTSAAKIFTSPDGEVWTERYSTDTSTLNSLAYGNGAFVIFTGSSIVRSTDGLNWTTHAAPATGSFIEFVNGQFLIASANTVDLHVSTDGLTWTTRSYGATGAREITYANNQYLLTGDSGLLLTSPDATTWTRRVTNSTAALRSAAYNAGPWVVLGNTDFPATILTSTDSGATWTNRTTSLTYNTLHQLATDGTSSLIAVGPNGTIARSTNGTTWSLATSGVTDELEGATYGAGRYIVTGASGRILTSTDAGVTWTNVTSGTTAYLDGANFLNDRFYANGDLGLLLTSTNGTTWTSSTVADGKKLRGMAYGSGRYVAVAAGGRIITSSDGITWTPATSGTTSDLNGVAFGNGKFLVTSAASVFSSPDGLVWTSAPAPEIPNWDSGTLFINGRFYAGLGVNSIISTSDGLTWTGHHLGTNYSDINGVVTFNGRLYVTGNAGMIYSGALAPSIVQQPVGEVIANGAPISLRVIAGGSALPVSYQWRRGGIAIPGATNPAFTITNATRADAGLYDVVLATTAGSVTSSPSIVSVAPTAYPGQLAADATWDPNPVTISTRTFAAVKLPSGKFLAGGESVRWDGQPRTALARLNADLTLDTTWTPPLINGIVYALAASTDGNVVYVGGDFTAVDGHTRPGLARLVGPDLNLDLLWRPLNALPAGPSQISALALQDNGQLLVARLSFVPGAVTGPNVLRRLNVDGTLDSTFSVDVTTAVAGQRIHSLIAEPGADPKIAFAGSFTAVNGTARGGIARVNSTGATLDTVFGGAGTASVVQFLTRLSNGRYVVGGNFTTFDSVSRNRVALLTAATGAVDTTFVTSSGTTNGNAHSVVELSDGRLLVFGNFTQYAANNTAGFIRLNATTGAFDSALSVGTGAQSVAFNISGAGRNMHGFLLNAQDQVGYIGSFNELLGQRRVAAARINAGVSNTDASDVSKTLVATPSLLVHRPAFTGAAFLEKNGALTVFGSADIAGGNSGLGQILRVNPNGSLDSSFPGGTGFGLNGLSTFGIYRAVRQGDGKFVATGDFNSYNGAPVNRIVRINPDGTRDSTFNPGTGPSSFIVTPVALANGKVALFGAMGLNFAYNGSAALPGNIIRLNADGTRDTTFVPAGTSPNIGFNSAPSFVMESLNQEGPAAGSLLVVGSFTSYGGTTVPGIAMLNANGTLDTNFTYGGVGPGGGSITGAQPLGTGRLALFGSFTTFNGAPANRVVVLKGDPFLVDTTFTAPAALDAQVNQLLQQEDGKLIAVGEFSSGPALRLSSTGVVDSTFALQGITGFPGGSAGARFIMADDGSLYLHNTLVSLDYRAPRALVRFKGTAGVPAIAQAPHGGNFVVGSPFVLSVRAAGTAPYAYQWRKNDVAISGATDSVYFIPSATSASAGNYSVTITGPGGTVTSAPAALSLAVAPTIVTQPTAAVVRAGGTLTLQVTASGSFPFTYQWRKGSVPIDGATALFYSKHGFAADDAGNYDVIVTNAAGTVTSSAAAVTLAPAIGTLASDPAFTRPDFKSDALAGRVTIDSLGRVYATWTNANVISGVGNQLRGAVIRFNADGTVDPTFNIGAALVDAWPVTLQADGKILVGGIASNESSETGFDLPRVFRFNPDGTRDFSYFSPHFAASPRFMTMQPDGKLLVVASSNTGPNGGIPVMARLNPDGSLDSTFTQPALSANGSIFLPPVVDASGNIYVGGIFSTINGVARPAVARLLATGVVDTGFVPAGFTVGGGTQVRGLALQTQGANAGKLLVAGGPLNVSGVNRPVIRLLSTGALDTTFTLVTQADAGMSVRPRLLNALADDRFYVVGSTVTRFLADGAVDTSYTKPAFSIEFFWMDTMADGRVVVPPELGATINGNPAPTLVRFTATGAVDPTFAPARVNREIYPGRFAVLPDSKLLTWGQFDRVITAAVPGIARLNLNGSLDTGFAVTGVPNLRYVAFAELGADGRILAGTRAGTNPAALTSGIVRLQPDGALDPSFTLDASLAGSTNGMEFRLLPDNKVSVWSLSAQGLISESNFLRRLTETGAIDATFTPTGLGTFGSVYRTGGATGAITSITLGAFRVIAHDAAGRLIARATTGSYPAGATSINYTLLRINADGSLDTTFAAPTTQWSTTTSFPTVTDAQTNGGVAAQATAHVVSGSPFSGAVPVSGGKLLVYGIFSQLGGQPAPGIARLTTTGALDTTFNVGTGAQLRYQHGRTAQVEGVTVAADGKIWVTGAFDTFNGVAAPGIVRLNADGTVDLGFATDIFYRTYLGGLAQVGFAPNGTVYVSGTYSRGGDAFPSAFQALVNSATPVISTQPVAAQNLVLGATATFTVAASGTDLTFQWRKNGENIAGATSATYTINPVAVTDSGLFDVVIANGAGSVASRGSVLAVSASVALRDQPVARRVAAGATVQFAVSATTTISGATLTYQWRKDAGVISGATSSALTLTRVAAANAGAYTVIVSDGTNSVTSQPAGLVVTPADPVLWQQFTEFSTEQAPARTVHDGAGKVYVPWSVQDRGPDMANGKFVGALARFDEATGALDPSFRLDRRIRGANHLVVLPDGKFLIATRLGDASSVVRVTATGEFDPAFTSPLFARSIRFITRQSDGKVIVVATDNLDPNAPASAIGADAAAVYRLDANGALDATFTRVVVNTGIVFGPPVVDSSGQIYLAGSFNQLNGTSRYGMARLTSTGALDTTYAVVANLPAGAAYTQIRSVALQSDGRAVFVGDFRYTARGTSADRIMAVRFNTDGTFDTTFAQPLQTQLGIAASSGLRLRHLVILPDDKIVAVSDRVVRLTANGAPDAAFTSRVFGKEAFWLSVGATGRIFVPDQTSIAGQATPLSTISNGIVTTLADGTPDFSFQTGGWGRIAYPTQAAVLADGRVVIAGEFNRIGGRPVAGLAMLEADGTVSANQADPSHSHQSSSVAAASGAQIYALIDRAANSTETGAPELVRGLPGIGEDTTFVPALPSGYSLASARLHAAPEGKLLLSQPSVAVQAALAGSVGDSLIRLNVNGSRDTGYTPALSSFAVVERNGTNQITAIKTGGLNVAQVLPDGRALVIASAVDGNVRLLRLNADGTADTGFSPPSFGTLTGSSGFTTLLTDPVTGTTTQFPLTTYSSFDLIRTAVQMPDGKVYVGGRFQLTYANAPRGLARLNANGFIDTTFTGTGAAFSKPDAGAYVSKLAVDSVGRLYVAGRFDGFNGNAVAGLFRLAADGTIDASWNPGFAVLDAPRADVNLIVAGDKLHAFGTVGLPGDPLPAIHRVVTLSGAPVIAPATGTGGTPVTLAGFGFAGTTVVKFNGLDAVFTVVSDTVITATVPALATTGPITLVTPGGTQTVAGTFTVTTGPNLVNLSSRGFVGTGENALLVNFTVETNTKTVLLRAVGPALSVFGVTGVLADPVLTVHDATGAEIARNDDWPAALASDFTSIGAFPLTAGSKDSALKITLAPGTYTARVTGAAATTGVALVEAYSVGSAERLAHLALRLRAGTGADSSIAGFVVSGTGQRTVLIRAVGSPLVTALGAAANPSLRVFNGSGTQIAENDDWVSSAELTAATAAAGALPLAATDSALLVSLAPGNYNVQATSASGTGFVLTEIHAIDSFRAESFKPALLAPLQNTSVAAGAPFTLNAPVLAKPAAVTYVWKKDGATVTPGVPLAGSPGALHLPSALTTDTGLYTVEMTNTAGTTVSAPATVAVAPPAGYSATHAVAGTGGYLAGGTVTITNTLTYVSPSQSLGWSVTLPAGWSYVSSSGDAGETRPTVGATGNISWAWTTVPTATSVTFTYTLAVPAGETTARGLTAFAIARPGGNPVMFVANPNPLTVSAVVAHSADTNQDFRIGLIELTRVIELFNTRNGTVRTGRYAVATTATEDGFAPDPVTAPGATVTLTRYHSADTARTATRDGKIDLIELTRVIELYNTRAGTVRTGAYRAAAGTEDGYESVP
jgi:uncharacterized delta-60 repeat protein